MESLSLAPASCYIARVYLSEHVLRVDMNRIRLILQSHFLQVTTLPLSPLKPQAGEHSVTCCQKPQPSDSVGGGGGQTRVRMDIAERRHLWHGPPLAKR